MAELRALSIGEKGIKAFSQQGRLAKLVRGLYVDNHSLDSVAQTIAGRYKNVTLGGKSVAQIHSRPPLTFPIQAEDAGSVQAETFSIEHSRLPVYTNISDLSIVEALWATRASKDYTRRILETHYTDYDGHRRFNHDLSRMRKIPVWLYGTIATTPTGACNELERELARPLIKRGHRSRMNQYIGPYCFDILFDQRKIVIEVGSERYRVNVDSFIIDRWKTNSDTLRGQIVLRFMGSYTSRSLDSILDEIKQIIRWVRKRRPHADYKSGWPASQRVWEWSPTAGYANK